jgi:amino acid adenylation domain-containing protein
MEDTVDTMVRRMVAHAPAAVAVDAPDATLSYRELLERADALGDSLRSAGAGPEVPVGLCLPRSAALVTGALGILVAGSAYVALDPTGPPKRLQTILADSGAPLLVTTADGLRPPDTVQVLPPFGPPSPATRPPQAARRHRDGLAYMIYTSGSTGTPKGVLVAHRALRRLVDWHHRAFRLRPGDRVAQVASPGFDACVWETWATLTAGASLHVPTDDVRSDPLALRDWIVGSSVTVAFVPTGLAEALTTLTWPPATALRILLTGGDTLHRRPPAGLPFDLVNNYGLTEGAVVSTSGTVGADGAGPPSIGTPVDHAEVHIVDDRLRLVSEGRTGQLLIGGPGLARGYTGQPALTAQRFIPDHLGGNRGGRLLCTGDLARRRPDGAIQILGRLDEQIERNGFRIEPAEVAAALSRHPAVRSAVVLVEPGGRPHPRLLAYLVGEAGAASRQALDAFAAGQLPAYMIPNDYVWLPELPMTINGKVDRTMLPLPAEEGAKNTDVDQSAATELEEALVPIVAEVLKLPTVAIDADFFRLGGHSLLGAQVIMRLRERYGVTLSLRFVFANSTVRKMAAGLEAALLDEMENMSEAEAAEHLGRVSRP